MSSPIHEPLAVTDLTENLSAVFELRGTSHVNGRWRHKTVAQPNTDLESVRVLEPESEGTADEKTAEREVV